MFESNAAIVEGPCFDDWRWAGSDWNHVARPLTRTSLMTVRSATVTVVNAMLNSLMLEPDAAAGCSARCSTTTGQAGRVPFRRRRVHMASPELLALTVRVYRLPPPDGRRGRLFDCHPVLSMSDSIGLRPAHRAAVRPAQRPPPAATPGINDAQLCPQVPRPEGDLAMGLDTGGYGCLDRGAGTERDRLSGHLLSETRRRRWWIRRPLS